MKLSHKQQILEHAKAHPEGFKAADLAYTGMKPPQIARKLWELKKKKILTHNIKKHTYSLNTFNETPKKQVAPKTQAKPATRERDNQTLQMIDNMLKEVIETEEKYQDALAIIRYLENKLYIAIQREVDHNRGLDAGG